MSDDDKDDNKVYHGEIIRRLSSQDRILEEIRSDVKAQNGKVANHAVRLAVLEERSGSAAKDGGKQGAIAGGVVGGGAVLLEILRHFFLKP